MCLVSVTGYGKAAPGMCGHGPNHESLRQARQRSSRGPTLLKVVETRLRARVKRLLSIELRRILEETVEGYLLMHLLEE